jgi:hypothetical protein
MTAGTVLLEHLLSTVGVSSLNRLWRWLVIGLSRRAIGQPHERQRGKEQEPRQGSSQARHRSAFHVYECKSIIERSGGFHGANLAVRKERIPNSSHKLHKTEANITVDEVCHGVV